MCDINIDKPTLEYSEEIEDEVRNREDARNLAECQVEAAEFSKFKREWRQAIGKACGQIERHCSKDMITSLRQEEDSNDIRKEPIEFLLRIKTLMHQHSTTTYPFESLINLFVKLVTTMQQDNEELGDFYKRLKNIGDTIKSQLGSTWLDVFATKLPEYIELDAITDSVGQGHIKKLAHDKFIGQFLLRNVDQRKYGSVNTTMRSQYSMGISQYRD